MWFAICVSSWALCNCVLQYAEHCAIVFCNMPQLPHAKTSSHLQDRQKSRDRFPHANYNTVHCWHAYKRYQAIHLPFERCLRVKRRKLSVVFLVKTLGQVELPASLDPRCASQVKICNCSMAGALGHHRWIFCNRMCSVTSLAELKFGDAAGGWLMWIALWLPSSWHNRGGWLVQWIAQW